jgi:TRAP-type C4-dicarboxylate transport system substrate-binding protein
MVEVNKQWYDSLPPDLQKIIDDDATAQQAAIAPVASDIVSKTRKGWTEGGGELISLPPDEQAEMMKTFSSTVAQVAEAKPALNEAYKIVSEAAQRTK